METLACANSKGTALLRYRNRAIGEDELRYLRWAVERWGHTHTRPQLARAICVEWEWRQANGDFAVFACQDLLLRLEQWGYLKLPGLRRAPKQRPSLPLIPGECVALPWTELPPAPHLSSLVVRPIEAEERLGWRLFMDRYHYLGDKPIIGEHLLYAAWLEGELVALLGWASAALRAPLRDRFIGWSESVKRQRLHLVANNVRYLVLPWVRVKCLASKILGCTLRRLSADWQARWNHPVLLAESFVDLRRFRGTCYRASNWKMLGMTAGRTRRGNAYLFTGSPKALYVYELRRGARRLLSAERCSDDLAGCRD